MTKPNKRAFTLVELLVVISIIALLVGLLLPAIGRARRNAQQVKDGTQVRAIQQGLVIWANDNKERYPVPNLLDRQQQTESYSGDDRGWKNRTGNIWSILIFNKVVPEPDVYVSPSEKHPYIRPIFMGDKGGGVYEFQTVEPGSAPGETNTVNPKNALWDPSFKGAPVLAAEQATGMTSDVSDVPSPIGNNSYAHAPLRGEIYERRWGTIESLSTVPVIGNRGPIFKFTSQVPTDPEDYELAENQPGEAYSLLIHGGKSTWEGNVAYNDGHVSFETSFAPQELSLYARANKFPDNLFVSEVLEQDQSEFREDAFLFVWKRGMRLNPDRDHKPLDFNPQGGGRLYMWADELQAL